MKLGLFTDPHYCDKEIPSPRKFSLSYNKVKEAMDYFKARCVDQVICLGDLVDDCKNYDENVRSIKKIMSLIRSYNLPFFCLMGNHDYQNFTKDEFNELTGGAYPPARVDFGETSFLFLDCNYGDDGHAYEPNNVEWTDTCLPREQLSALKFALKDEKIKNAYVFSHQNIDNQVEVNHVVHNADEIRKVLSNSEKVRIVFQGHYHFGHDAVIDGVRYHTLPSMCGDETYYEIFVVE